jgi:hypothetical protein
LDTVQEFRTDRRHAVTANVFVGDNAYVAQRKTPCVHDRRARDPSELTLVDEEHAWILLFPEKCSVYRDREELRGATRRNDSDVFQGVATEKQR